MAKKDDSSDASKGFENPFQYWQSVMRAALAPADWTAAGHENKPNERPAESRHATSRHSTNPRDDVLSEPFSYSMAALAPWLAWTQGSVSSQPREPLGVRQGARTSTANASLQGLDMLETWQKLACAWMEPWSQPNASQKRAPELGPAAPFAAMMPWLSAWLDVGQMHRSGNHPASAANPFGWMQLGWPMAGGLMSGQSSAQSSLPWNIWTQAMTRAYSEAFTSAYQEALFRAWVEAPQIAVRYAMESQRKK